MAPLADHLVGYLSMFLQQGVLALLMVLAVLVRTSLGRRGLDGWTVGLGANALALLILGVAALGRDTHLVPALPAAIVAYAFLEDLAAAGFVVGARGERGVRAVPAWLVATMVVALTCTAIAGFRTDVFFDVYRVHSAFFSLLLATATVEVIRARIAGLGARLLIAALAALTLDYAHVPLLTALGVVFPPNYLGLESYLTVVLDVTLGVALVVRATDGAHVELERRNSELALAQYALEEAVYMDALCGIPNRAAFVDRMAQPPASGTIAMIDLDGLKAINDRFGHAAGDASLEMAARALRDRCTGGSVYRIGGDEFAMIWNGIGEEGARAQLAAVARDLRVLAEDVRSPARISWGVAEFGDGRAFADALIAADADLYDSRTSRRRA